MKNKPPKGCPNCCDGCDWLWPPVYNKSIYDACQLGFRLQRVNLEGENMKIPNRPRRKYPAIEGFYWYIPSNPKKEPEVVRIKDGLVWAIGTNLAMSYPNNQGHYVGPLQVRFDAIFQTYFSYESGESNEKTQASKTD